MDENRWMRLSRIHRIWTRVCSFRSLGKQFEQLPELRISSASMLFMQSSIFVGLLTDTSIYSGRKKSVGQDLASCAPKSGLPTGHRESLGNQIQGRGGRPAGRAELLANFGRRGTGRIPRRCKPRGPSRDPVGILPGARTFRQGLIGKIPAKFRHTCFSIYFSSDFIHKIPAKFRQHVAKIRLTIQRNFINFSKIKIRQTFGKHFSDF